MYFCNYIALWFVMLSYLMTYTNSEYRMRGCIDANIRDHPHVVAILYDNKPQCVGSLINMNKAVTAGNCVEYYPENSYTVAAGVANLCDEHVQIHNVKKIHYSYEYAANPETRDMRIAVVEVHGMFDQGPTVQAIEYRGCRFPDTTVMTVTGWGHTFTKNGITSNILQSTHLILSNYEVRNLMQDGFFEQTMTVEALDIRVVDVEFIGAPGVVERKLCAVMLHNLGDTSVFTCTNTPDNIEFLNRMINC